jgi:putative heme transporter
MDVVKDEEGAAQIAEAVKQDLRAEPPPTPLYRKPWFRRGAAGAIGIAVIVATFFFVLPQFADYRQVWEEVSGLTWQQLVLLAVVEIANLGTYGIAWIAVLPGLGYRQALVVSLSSTASSLITPGGSAVGTALAIAMFRGWGFRARRIALGATLVGIWNQLFTLGAPALAVGLLVLTGGDTAALKTVALLSLAVFVFVVGASAAALASPRGARWAGDTAARIVSRLLRVIRRGPVTWTGEDVVRLREETLQVLGRRWISLTAATLVGQLTVFLVLLVSLRTLGVPSAEVSLLEAFAAWSLARVLGSLPITPGGLGVVELGLTSALVSFGGTNANVVAAVLLYRFLTVVPTLVVGLLAGATWRRHGPPTTLTS